MLAAAPQPAPPVWFVDPRLQEGVGEGDRSEKVEVAVKTWQAGRVQILREEMERIKRAEELSKLESSSAEKSPKRAVSNLEHAVGRHIEGLRKGDLMGEKEAAAERAKRSQRRHIPSKYFAVFGMI